MYHSTMFEDMGFEYIGPVDGHNVEELERTLRSIYQRPGPHFAYCDQKGKGYQPAEMNPGNYHGVSAFDPDGMPDPEVAPKESFSTVSANCWCRREHKPEALRDHRCHEVRYRTAILCPSSPAALF